MPKLVIVESPAKAKTIGKYLGRGYKVTASMGHVRDLPASTLGIDVENGYKPKYITIKGKQKLVIDKKDIEYMDGKRILIVDDVISTGGSLHALETLAAIYVGLQLFGLFGFLLGPIGLLIIKDFVEEYGDEDEGTVVYR